jgi:hypothetical protein
MPLCGIGINYDPVLTNKGPPVFYAEHRKCFFKGVAGEKRL